MIRYKPCVWLEFVIPSPRGSAAGPGVSRGENLISYAILSSLLISYANFSTDKLIFSTDYFLKHINFVIFDYAQGYHLSQ
jgi:hypothetical protein